MFETFLGSLVLWLAFAFICPVVAKQKGREDEEGKWFLLGLIFGVFAFIWILIISPNEKALEEKKVKEGDFKKCPFCAEIIRKEAIVCRYCGRDVKDDVEVKEAEAPDEKSSEPEPVEPEPVQEKKIEVANQTESSEAEVTSDSKQNALDEKEENKTESESVFVQKSRFSLFQKNKLKLVIPFIIISILLVFSSIAFAIYYFSSFESRNEHGLFDYERKDFIQLRSKAIKDLFGDLAVSNGVKSDILDPTTNKIKGRAEVSFSKDVYFNNENYYFVFIQLFNELGEDDLTAVVYKAKNNEWVKLPNNLDVMGGIITASQRDFANYEGVQEVAINNGNVMFEINVKYRGSYSDGSEYSGNYLRLIGYKNNKFSELGRIFTKYENKGNPVNFYYTGNLKNINSSNSDYPDIKVVYQGNDYDYKNDILTDKKISYFVYDNNESRYIDAEQNIEDAHPLYVYIEDQEKDACSINETGVFSSPYGNKNVPQKIEREVSTDKLFLKETGTYKSGIKSVFYYFKTKAQCVATVNKINSEKKNISEHNAKRINEEIARIGLPNIKNEKDFKKNFGSCNKDISEPMRFALRNMGVVSFCRVKDNPLCSNKIEGYCSNVLAGFDKFQNITLFTLTANPLQKNKIIVPYQNAHGDVKPFTKEDDRNFTYIFWWDKPDISVDATVVDEKYSTAVNSAVTVLTVGKHQDNKPVTKAVIDFMEEYSER